MPSRGGTETWSRGAETRKDPSRLGRAWSLSWGVDTCLRYITWNCKRDYGEGRKSVAEYYEEFKHLRNHLQLDESKEMLITQFLDGLQDRIMRKVERQSYGRFQELLNLTIQIEQQVKMKVYSVNCSRAQGIPSWSPTSSLANNTLRTQDKAKKAIVETQFKPRDHPKDNW